MNAKRLLLIGGTAIGLIASVVAVAQTQTNGIDQVRKQWVQAFNAKDSQALRDLYDQNAVLMPPTGERIVGKEKITEYFGQMFASASRLTMNPESDRSDSSGDLGFDGGHYEETVVTGGGIRGAIIRGAVIQGGGGTQSVHRGNYLVVLKRLTGKWLIVQQATTEVPQTGK